MWGWLAWSIAVLAVWVIVAAFVGVLLGQAIRRSDRRTPDEPVESFPPPRAPAEEPPVPEHRRRT